MTIVACETFTCRWYMQNGQLHTQMDDDQFYTEECSMHISNYNCILNMFKIRDVIFHTDLNLLHRNDKRQMTEDKTRLLKLNRTLGQQMRDDVGKCQTRKQKANTFGKSLKHSNHKWSWERQVFCLTDHCSKQWQRALVNRKNNNKKESFEYKATTNYKMLNFSWIWRLVHNYWFKQCVLNMFYIQWEALHFLSQFLDAWKGSSLVICW